jgi:hypothetical protein
MSQKNDLLRRKPAGGAGFQRKEQNQELAQARRRTHPLVGLLQLQDHTYRV